MKEALSKTAAYEFITILSGEVWNKQIDKVEVQTPSKVTEVVNDTIVQSLKRGCNRSPEFLEPAFEGWEHGDLVTIRIRYKNGDILKKGITESIEASAETYEERARNQRKAERIVEILALHEVDVEHDKGIYRCNHPYLTYNAIHGYFAVRIPGTTYGINHLRRLEERLSRLRRALDELQAHYPEVVRDD